MKASALIALLQQRIEEHGDLECTITNQRYDGDFSVDSVDYDQTDAYHNDSVGGPRFNIS